MKNLPRYRPLLPTTFEQHKLFFGTLAHDSRNRIDIDNCTSVYLPEALGVQLRKQALSTFARARST